MERSYVLNGEVIVILNPRSCDFNADFGHCRFPLGDTCECSADWRDSSLIDFPACCPLKLEPACSMQMEQDFAGKWDKLVQFTCLFGFSEDERISKWHNWEPN